MTDMDVILLPSFLPYVVFSVTIMLEDASEFKKGKVRILIERYLHIKSP